MVREGFKKKKIKYLTAVKTEGEWGGGDSLEYVLKIRGGHYKVDIFPLLTSSKLGTNYVYIRPKLIYNHSGRAPTLLVHHL